MKIRCCHQFGIIKIQRVIINKIYQIKVIKYFITVLHRQTQLDRNELEYSVPECEIYIRCELKVLETKSRANRV